MVKSIKEYVVSKRFLYMLCFTLLFIIDWTRGSQAGAIWAWTINMTGVVMAAILFSAYSPKEFLKPVYILYSIVAIGALLTAYYWWNLNQAVIFRDQLLTAILNIWFLGIFVIKMFLDVAVYKIKKFNFCKLEMVAAVMLLWMLFSVNEDIWPGWYLVIFGLFYHTKYSKKDMDMLKEGMLDGIITAFFLLQGAAFVFRPYDEVRYKGIYSNCNMNALFYGIVWIAFLIRLYNIRKMKEKKWKEILCFIFAGIMSAFSFMTGCRTAWMSMFITGFFYVIFADFHSLKYKSGQFLKKLCMYIVVAGISIPITFGAARYLPPIFHHPVWYDWEYNIYRVHSFDPWDSEKYVSWETFSDGLMGRIKPIFKMVFGEEQAGLITVQAAAPTTASETGERVRTVDRSVSIRLEFWKYYLRNGNLKGHYAAEGHNIPELEGHYVWHTQNTFVQFWYYYGIPSAVLFVIVMVMLMLISIKKILEGRGDALICILYLVFWGGYGLAESVWYPGQMILLLVFFTPKFLEKIEEEREEKF